MLLIVRSTLAICRSSRSDSARSHSQVGAQGRGVVGGVEHLADGGHAQPELAQHQDPLQPGQGGGVVVAVAVGPDPGRLEQADVAVVAQRAAGRARPGGRPRRSRTPPRRPPPHRPSRARSALHPQLPCRPRRPPPFSTSPSPACSVITIEVDVTSMSTRAARRPSDAGSPA